MFKAIFALPRTVWLLGLVSLFNDSTSELIYPLVPLFRSWPRCWWPGRVRWG